MAYFLHPTIAYNVIPIFCSLSSLKMYALQKWWEKAWQQKGIKTTYHCKNQVKKIKVEHITRRLRIETQQE